MIDRSRIFDIERVQTRGLTPGSTAMFSVQYGVVRIDGRWTIISEGLRFGAYDTSAEAEQVARLMADQAAGAPVQLHLQDEAGELRREDYVPPSEDR